MDLSTMNFIEVKGQLNAFTSSFMTHPSNATRGKKFVLYSTMLDHTVVLLKLILPAQFEMQYLPPYSPFPNICENAFALWKQALKTRLAVVLPRSSRPTIQ
ncbi:hypothetical protein ElyMa_000347800 [Elysia marginata]|uniref:Tc1-like transposase DDE domain-containing protein n=1 Tax=Elysia marginata TaxID=1093978 RepID=A0AAV4FD40_9GAST|nr:hypothetical protein ElyMa_000347800 [Elysia marginata]